MYAACAQFAMSKVAFQARTSGPEHDLRATQALADDSPIANKSRTTNEASVWCTVGMTKAVARQK